MHPDLTPPDSLTVELSNGLVGHCIVAVSYEGIPTRHSGITIWQKEERDGCYRAVIKNNA